MKLLWLLRLSALTLLIVVATKPVVVRPDPGLPTAWAVLVDSSLSMSVKDPVQRLDQAKKVIPDLLKKFPAFDLFRFDETTRELSAEELDTLKPKGKKTDFAQALKDMFKDQRYRGALIFSDGRHIGQGDAVNQAASAGKPLLLVGLGDRALFKDVSVRKIQSPPFAFKNVQTSLSAVVSVVGYPGKTITVRLKEKGKVLALQTLQVNGSDVESTVTFNWTPGTLGTRILTVEVSQYSGEFTTLNNRKDVTLDVGRDRFRVLYICGSPGPEYGFLRHQFKADPAVELVTFVILRNASNVVNVPDAELSLIPFPTQDVLINQMASFDLIVFEEFSYQQFGLRPQVLYAIRKKVEDGGSFLVMGGQVMLGQGSPYALPGIQEMIPVEVGKNTLRTLQKPVRFVPKAPNHPILRLAQNPKENKKIWNSLPLVEDVTLLTSIKPGAAPLAMVRHDGKEFPVLTAWKYGKGRVAVLTTRTTWRFSMLEGQKGPTSGAYQQFWKNMVLWLTHSDEFKNVRVAVDKRRIRLGEDQSVRIWTYDEYFKPISDVDVRVQLKAPNGQTQELKAYQETKGVFLAPFKADQLGRHTARAWVLRKGKKLGEDRIRFGVIEGFYEQEDLRPDFDHLKELAHATGGKFLKADEFSVEAFTEFNQDMNEKVGKKILLWNSPWFLGGILLFLILEWFLRMRRGLP